MNTEEEHRILTLEEAIERDRKAFEDRIKNDIDDVICCFEYSLNTLADLLLAIEDNKEMYEVKNTENLDRMKQACVAIEHLKEPHINKISSDLEIKTQKKEINI